MQGGGRMKLQSAMEYMVTYGWAIIIIAVALAALVALGVFNPATFTGQECIMAAGFSCINYFLASNGVLTLNLEQATPTTVTITAVGCNLNLTTANMYVVPNNGVNVTIGGNYTFTGVQCYNYGTAFSGSVGSLFKGSLAVNYTDTQTGFPHTIYGTLIAKVTQ